MGAVGWNEKTRQQNTMRETEILDAKDVGNSQGQNCLWGERLRESDHLQGWRSKKWSSKVIQ